MPDSFHRMAFAEEIPDTNVPSFYLEFLDCDESFPPLGFVDDPIPTFAYVTFYLELLPVDLEIGVKGAVLADAAYLKLGGCLALLVSHRGALCLLYQRQVQTLQNLVLVLQLLVLLQAYRLLLCLGRLLGYLLHLDFLQAISLQKKGLETPED